MVTTESSVNLAGKILYVCRENIGRSQVAEALWELEPRGVEAVSAGIYVDHVGQTIIERPEAKTLIDVMEWEYGIDIRKRTRTRLADFSQSSLNQALMIVVMAEAAVVPPSLIELPNCRTWEVRDLKDCGELQTIEIVRHIKQGVDNIRRDL